MFQCAAREGVIHAKQSAAALRGVFEKSVSAAPFRSGMRIHAINRQIASNPTVNKIRDFSSGILKQFANVLTMERNMS